MGNVQNLFAHDPTIQALANLFGILAGVALLITMLRWLWRFVRDAYANSLKQAWRGANDRLVLEIAFLAHDNTALTAQIGTYQTLILMSLGGLVLGNGGAGGRLATFMPFASYGTRVTLASLV